LNAPIPPDEQHRLAALRRYQILDTPPDGAFDRVAALAAELFSTPIAIISLVDHDRIWFKSHHGLEVRQIGRDSGLCASAIMQTEAWLVNDASRDPRTLANPLVAGDFGLRFYLGLPLRTHDGFSLGTLCVIDREPRAVSERQIAQLGHLAAVVMDQMELRLSARRAVSSLSHAVAEKDAALRRAELMAREIDHRVKNSLQLVSALLTMQSRQVRNPEAASELALAAGRVAAVARVHQHIYGSEGVERIDCKAYLERLCDDLCSVLRPGETSVCVKAVSAEIGTDRIVEIGLIVNELLTNATKHGARAVVVAFEREGSGFALSVSDDGPGLPADFDATTGSGLGMKLVVGLARQLGGELSIGRDERVGARLTVRFPSA